MTHLMCHCVISNVSFAFEMTHLNWHKWFKVDREGLEPPTSWSAINRSIQPQTLLMLHLMVRLLENLATFWQTTLLMGESQRWPSSWLAFELPVHKFSETTAGFEPTIQILEIWALPTWLRRLKEAVMGFEPTTHKVLEAPVLSSWTTPPCFKQEASLGIEPRTRGRNHVWYISP